MFLDLSNINLDLANKNIEVIMGLSGSGKSTLIRHINRLIEPTAGSIMIGGEDVIQMPMEKLRNLGNKKQRWFFKALHCFLIKQLWIMFALVFTYRV